MQQESYPRNVFLAFNSHWPARSNIAACQYAQFAVADSELRIKFWLSTIHADENIREDERLRFIDVLRMNRNLCSKLGLSF